LIGALEEREENLILSNVLIRGESNFDDKYVEKC
jgi:hypothetical protein